MGSKIEERKEELVVRLLVIEEREISARKKTNKSNFSICI